MKKIEIPTSEQIVAINKLVCAKGGNPHHCYDIGKIESALYTSFYPGEFPYEAGGVAKLAGAMCFYLVMAHAFLDGNKRTGALAAITFMNINKWTLKYSIDKSTGDNAFAVIIENCAASKVGKEELIKWFDSHKVKF